jgi:ATP-dependent DNA helicase PIF1
VQDESSEAAIVAASIISMPNWQAIPKVRLTIPFRNKDDPELAAFVERVAQGAIEMHQMKDSVPLIRLPPHLVKPFTDEDEALRWFMDKTDGDGASPTFHSKAVLSPTNRRVDELNRIIQERRGTRTTTLTASTKLRDGQKDSLGLDLAPEMLYDLGANNTPPHLLQLAEGDVVFLMRTLDKRKKLTTNTRLQILDVKTRFVKVQTLGDRPQTHLIPRITFTFKMARRKPLLVNRLQFPLRLAYAMTFNKAQGQTLDKVLIDGTSKTLSKHECHGAFTHGHCNVAISRVRRRQDIAILVDEHNIAIDPHTGERSALTANIVFDSIVTAP